MQIKSLAEGLTIEDGIVSLSFDLSTSEAGYLLISKPADAEALDEFFGADHYVEVRDQLFGHYGGLELLIVLDDREFAVTLAKEVPGLGRELRVTTVKPMASDLLVQLRELART